MWFFDCVVGISSGGHLPLPLHMATALTLLIYTETVNSCYFLSVSNTVTSAKKDQCG